MKLSVVIPVRNRPALVAQCVSGVLACDYPHAEREILVVDNGSTDDTAAAAEAAGARVIVEPIANRCIARNRGAEEARAPWVAFIDSDCVPHPDWLAQLSRAIDELPAGRSVAALAGAIESAPPMTPVEAYLDHRRWFDQLKYLHPPRAARFTAPFALTANLCVHRDFYLASGGLDPTLPYPGEDADWCWRAAQAGGELHWAPAAVVTHHHRATPGALWRQGFDWGRGQADLFAKWHAEWGAARWIDWNYPVWALKGLAKAPWCLATGRTPLERRLAWYDFMANAGLWWGRVSGGIANRVWVA